MSVVLASCKDGKNKNNGWHQITENEVSYKIKVIKADDLFRSNRDEHSQHENYLYMKILMQKNGRSILEARTAGKSRSEFTKLVTFGLKPYVFLKDNKDHIYYPVDYSMERYYEPEQSTSFLFVFSKPEQKPDKLFFTIKEFGLGAGRQQIEISI